MATYRVGIIGTGYRKLPDGKERRGISYQHAPGYLKCPATEIVALADIVRENAERYAAHFEIAPAIYTDHRTMLAEAELDIVSICLPTGLHPQMVHDAAAAGVKAIHCEKPIAPTWGEAKRMVADCAERGVQLTFNHQRRFGTAYRKVKELIEAGVVGELTRLEGFTDNFMDWGTHWFDMMGFWNGDAAPVWALAQIDKRTDKKVFGLDVVDQGICWFAYDNGVQGVLSVGAEAKTNNPTLRVWGSQGVIELHWGQTPLRLMSPRHKGWEVLDLGGGLELGEPFVGAIADVVESLRTGREPELAARKALQSSELIFAAYESSRRRGRVDLPLDVDDSALLTMLAEGLIGPR